MARSDHGQVPGTVGAHLTLPCLVGLSGCAGDGCYCRCHAHLDEATRQRIRMAAGEAARQALDLALMDSEASPSGCVS